VIHEGDGVVNQVRGLRPPISLRQRHNSAYRPYVTPTVATVKICVDLFRSRRCCGGIFGSSGFVATFNSIVAHTSDCGETLVARFGKDAGAPVGSPSWLHYRIL
jgi:hypothetical protein